MRISAALSFLATLSQFSGALAQNTSAASSASSSSSPSGTSSIFSAPTYGPALTVNSSQFDITQHFCRLWRHASTFANGKIYIDGGNTYTPRNNQTYYNTPDGKFDQGMNGFLVEIDLSANFTNQDTKPYTAIPKPNYVPNGLIEKHSLVLTSHT